MSKKPKIDSIAGQIAIAQALAKEMVLPVELTVSQRKIFDDIIAARAATSWSNTDIGLACNLAQLQDLFNTSIVELIAEGSVYEGHNGRPTENPKHKTTMQLQSTINSLIRVLGISASQTGKAGKPAEAANRASDKARDALKRVANDAFS
jgi:hypothetical protein